MEKYSGQQSTPSKTELSPFHRRLKGVPKCERLCPREDYSSNHVQPILMAKFIVEQKAFITGMKWCHPIPVCPQACRWPIPSSPPSKDLALGPHPASLPTSLEGWVGTEGTGPSLFRSTSSSTPLPSSPTPQQTPEPLSGKWLRVQLCHLLCHHHPQLATPRCLQGCHSCPTPPTLL